MKIRQNKMMSYLAVTAGVGCAASTAEGAIVVVDLSGLSTGPGVKTLPAVTGDTAQDFEMPNSTNMGYLFSGAGSRFYGDFAGLGSQVLFARGYSGSAVSNFPSDPDGFTVWWRSGTTSGVSGFGTRENWVAFRDSSGKYGWMSFTLSSLGANNTLPIASFGKFVYDPASTSPANAITLQTAVAAAAVPEPSSLVLLALGATGLAARRQRKKAA